MFRVYVLDNNWVKFIQNLFKEQNHVVQPNLILQIIGTDHFPCYRLATEDRADG